VKTEKWEAPQGLAERLRAASKGLDHEKKIATRLGAVWQGREVEGHDKALEADELELDARKVSDPCPPARRTLMNYDLSVNFGFSILLNRLGPPPCVLESTYVSSQYEFVFLSTYRLVHPSSDVEIFSNKPLILLSISFSISSAIIRPDFMIHWPTRSLSIFPLTEQT